MGAAKGSAFRGWLENLVRDALRPYVSEQALEAATNGMIAALRGRVVVGMRQARPKRETERALAMRLPDVGVAWDHKRGGRRYHLRVLDEHTVELDDGEQATRFPSLKAVATAICGRPPGVGGWKFFFGPLTHEEVTAKYRQ